MRAGLTVREPPAVAEVDDVRAGSGADLDPHPTPQTRVQVSRTAATAKGRTAF